MIYQIYVCEMELKVPSEHLSKVERHIDLVFDFNKKQLIDYDYLSTKFKTTIKFSSKDKGHLVRMERDLKIYLRNYDVKVVN